MSRIHPTACVDPSSRIADDATIGPFCVIGPNVTIGSECHLIANVHVTGHTTIGDRTRVYPYTSLGTPPQSVNYRGGPTRLVIGAECDIREGVSINIGTEDGGEVTEIGDRGLFMANSHVGHDCRVGNDVVFANCATLGGHCTVGDHCFIGGLSGAHQFTRIGAHAMVAGATGVRSDVIPFGLAAGSMARLVGINIVGMKRKNFSGETIRAVRSAYRILFRGEGTFASRADKIETELGQHEAVAQIVAFVRADHNRPLCQPGRRSD
jgi:UDP-N-acetylglucosamine acyltransferase